MSLLYKRPDSPVWYVTKTRQSTRTTNRKLAEEFARKSLESAWRSERLGDQDRTFADLGRAWLDAKATKRTANRDEFLIRDFTAFLDRRRVRALTQIDAEALRQYASQVKARASASTANLYLTILGAMFRKAVAWGWLDTIPVVDRYRVVKTEPRWLTGDEFDAIAVRLPEWVRDMATIAVQTGLRYANVAGLRWSWISPTGEMCIVPATSTKTARPYAVPLNAAAREVISRRGNMRLSKFDEGRDFEQIDFDLVFYHPERPGQYVESVRSWWERACDDAKIRVRWHDLRHTWASWHIQNNTPSRVIQELAGWSSPAMMQRYAHLAVDHLAKYVDNVGHRPK